MSLTRILRSFGSFIFVLMVSSCSDSTLTSTPEGPAKVREASEWPEYGGGMGQRFAAEGEITPGNVEGLEVAWTYRHGDVHSEGDGRSGTAFQNTPLLKNGVMYICTPYNRVIALDPATGAEHWSFDPKINRNANLSNQYVCRGVSHYQDVARAGELCAETIFTATNGSELIALDAPTGQLCSDFGQNGIVSLLKGVGDIEWEGEYHPTSPPTVIGDVVVIGGSVGDNARRFPPSGVVRAYDVRSGALKWAFDLAPPDFDYDNEPASDEGYALGTPNVWAPTVADIERDLIFCQQVIRLRTISEKMAIDWITTAVLSLRLRDQPANWFGHSKPCITISGTLIFRHSRPSLILRRTAR